MIAGQDRRSIVCAKNRIVEDFLNIDISLLPFSTSECALLPDLATSFKPQYKARYNSGGATVERVESKRATKETGSRISYIATVMKGNYSGIPVAKS